ncbi:MAG: nuclear transport factor 2 family protein [Ilumatobacteraceae bacterium]
MELDTARHIVDQYLACWNEPRPDHRLDLVAATWTEDARSVDPLADVSGHEEISSMMSAVQAQLSGHQFRLVGDVNAHHDVIRWSWAMSAPDGGTVVAGTDAAVVIDGRIALLTGFFDS